MSRLTAMVGRTLLPLAIGLGMTGILQSAEGQEKRRLDSLELRVRQLEHGMTTLENRLIELEGRQKTNPTIPLTRHTWRQQRLGMTAEEVSALLGEPVVVQASHAWTTWCYHSHDCSGVGPATVRFFNAKVDSWKEP